MKKMISIIAIVAGGLTLLSVAASVIIGAIFKAQEASSVSIIGEADGPTAFMVVGTLGGGSAITEVVIGLLLIVAGILGYRKCKKSKGHE